MWQLTKVAEVALDEREPWIDERAREAREHGCVVLYESDGTLWVREAPADWGGDVEVRP